MVGIGFFWSLIDFDSGCTFDESGRRACRNFRVCIYAFLFGNVCTNASKILHWYTQYAHPQTNRTEVFRIFRRFLILQVRHAANDPDVTHHIISSTAIISDTIFRRYRIKLFSYYNTLFLYYILIPTVN